MSDNYQKTRLTRREEARSYRKIFLAFLATGLIIIFVIFLGLPALVNLAAFISGIKGEGDIPTSSQKLPLTPPVIDIPYEATNTAKISVPGSGNAGARVELFVNGDALKKILIPKNGNFVFDNVTLSKGENKIWGVLENSLNERSNRSKIVTVSYRNESPKVDISEPSDNAVISGDNKEVKVSGQTEGEMSVTVNGRMVIISSDGKFSYTLPLNDGDNKIEIVATDNFGNTTKIEKKVTYNQ